MLFTKLNHQLYFSWFPRSVKYLAIATSITVGLAMSESVWADCSQLQSLGCKFYCMNDHQTYDTAAACQQANCVPVVTLPACAPAITYTLTLKKDGTGSGTVTSSGYSGVTGSQFDVLAIPDSGSKFVGWSPANCGLQMTLNANITCTATFNKGDSSTPNTPITPSTPPLPPEMGLFIQVDGTGSGSVSTNTGLHCTRQDCQTNSQGEVTCNQEACRGIVTTGK